MYEWKLEIKAMYCPFAYIDEDEDDINQRYCNVNHEKCTEKNCRKVDKGPVIYKGEKIV